MIYADGKVGPGEQEQLDRLNKMLGEGTLKKEKSLEELVNDIVEDGVITVDERKALNEVIYADHHVNEEEQAQLDQIN